MVLQHVQRLSVYKYASRYVDVLFLIRFILLFAGIYFFNFGYMSLIDDRGLLYSSYLDQNLNYFAWLRWTILHMANNILHGIGLKSYVYDMFTIKAPNNHGVYVGLPCLGYGMISFWLAFALAHEDSTLRKVIYGLSGVLLLWLLNCSRVAMLIFAVQHRWNVNKWMDNHTTFNMAVYALTFLMIIAFYQLRKRQNSGTPAIQS